MSKPSPVDSIIDRHPSLRIIFQWLESGEDWVDSRVENLPVTIALLNAVSQESESPLMPDRVAGHAANAMNAFHASLVITLIDWIDRNPSNDIGKLFLADDAEVSESFRQRLRLILLVLLRADLINLFFNKEHLSWVKRHLK